MVHSNGVVILTFAREGHYHDRVVHLHGCGVAERLLGQTIQRGEATTEAYNRMQAWLERWKPAASARTHLLLASAMWTVVGSALLYFGVRWTLMPDLWQTTVILLVAATLGVLKGRFILEHAATRTIERIRTRGNGRCLGGFLSPTTWGLVVFMMVAGRVLRSGILPMPITGAIYAAIGIALLLTSRKLWAAWSQQSTEDNI